MRLHPNLQSSRLWKCRCNNATYDSSAWALTAVRPAALLMTSRIHSAVTTLPAIQAHYLATLSGINARTAHQVAHNQVIGLNTVRVEQVQLLLKLKKARRTLATTATPIATTANRQSTATDMPPSTPTPDTPTQQCAGSSSTSHHLNVDKPRTPPHTTSGTCLASCDNCNPVTTSNNQTAQGPHKESCGLAIADFISSSYTSSSSDE